MALGSRDSKNHYIVAQELWKSKIKENIENLTKHFQRKVLLELLLLELKRILKIGLKVTGKNQTLSDWQKKYFYRALASQDKN